MQHNVTLNGISYRVSELFWIFWQFTTERQAIFLKRLEGTPPPWTADQILARYRFTNCYRASDRVSQYLIQRVIYNQPWDLHDTIFRVLLFKIFNKIDTWEHLLESIGEPTLDDFDLSQYSNALSRIAETQQPLYSAAYMMPNPPYGAKQKYANHLLLLEDICRGHKLEEISESQTLEELYNNLLAVSSFGPFLAFQYSIDMNYSNHFGFSEMDYVIAGPGSCRGIQKCFPDVPLSHSTEVIIDMTLGAAAFLDNCGFETLWGRSLQLIDIQNIFCEIDKYSRVSHPHMSQSSNTRIKQSYKHNVEPIVLGYPPNWRLPYDAATPTTFEQLQTQLAWL